MHDTQGIIEQVRELAAQLDIADRLAIIRAIATLELPAPEIEPGHDKNHDELAAEQAAWFARPAAERRHYAADYVAVRHGAVVDQDPDQRALYLRVRARYGRAPVLIVPATWDQPPVLTFRSPRLDH
jgi:hypothetical protein